MKMDDLEFHPIDFGALSPSRWRVRRGFIGTLIAIYFVCAFFSAIVNLTPSDPPAPEASVAPQIEEGGSGESSQSAGLLKSVLEGDAVRAGQQAQAVITSEHSRQLTMLATFGFLGSLFSITRVFVLTTVRFDMPVVWYLTRPFQSILMAWFLYYTFLASQFIFFGGDQASMGIQNINIYTLAILAIVAGVFTEQAYDALRQFAGRLFCKGAGGDDSKPDALSGKKRAPNAEILDGLPPADGR